MEETEPNIEELKETTVSNSKPKSKDIKLCKFVQELKETEVVNSKPTPNAHFLLQTFT